MPRVVLNAGQLQCGVEPAAIVVNRIPPVIVEDVPGIALGRFDFLESLKRNGIEGNMPGLPCFRLRDSLTAESCDGLSIEKGHASLAQFRIVNKHTSILR